MSPSSNQTLHGCLQVSMLGQELAFRSFVIGDAISAVSGDLPAKEGWQHCTRISQLLGTNRQPVVKFELIAGCTRLMNRS